MGKVKNGYNAVTNGLILKIVHKVQVIQGIKKKIIKIKNHPRRGAMVMVKGLTTRQLVRCAIAKNVLVVMAPPTTPAYPPLLMR